MPAKRRIIGRSQLGYVCFNSGFVDGRLHAVHLHPGMDRTAVKYLRLLAYGIRQRCAGILIQRFDKLV